MYDKNHVLKPSRFAICLSKMIHCALPVAVLLLASPAFAVKDMTNRMGIGFRNQFSTELPGVAVQYYPSSDLGLAAVLGVDTQTDNSKFGFMVKGFRIIFSEDNLNFYMGGGAGLLSLQQGAGGKNESGFELQGFAGAEFFFTGLENLGFSFEVGAGITSISSGVRFRTLGDNPARAGVVFYF